MMARSPKAFWASISPRVFMTPYAALPSWPPDSSTVWGWTVSSMFVVR